MIYAKYRVPLDIHETISQAVIPFKQNDSNRRIEFCLREDGRNYTINPECTAVLRAVKPDGTVLFNATAIMDNMIIYDLTPQTTAAVGAVECDLTLYGNDGHQITSPRFLFVIEETVVNDIEVESEDEFSALAQAISDTNNLNIDIDKQGITTTVTLTKKDGTQKIVEIYDGNVEISELLSLLNGKVDKVEGKGLSTNDFTDEYKAKVDANTQKVSNVQADWNATTGPAVILNKPDIGGGGDGDNNVKYIPQFLTDAQKAQARANLSVPSSAEVTGALLDKVDKVSGKGLSTNDFTDDYKDQLDNLKGGAFVITFTESSSVISIA